MAEPSFRVSRWSLISLLSQTTWWQSCSGPSVSEGSIFSLGWIWGCETHRLTELYHFIEGTCTSADFGICEGLGTNLPDTEVVLYFLLKLLLKAYNLMSCYFNRVRPIKQDVSQHSASMKTFTYGSTLLSSSSEVWCPNSNSRCTPPLWASFHFLSPLWGLLSNIFSSQPASFSHLINILNCLSLSKRLK